MTGTLSIEALAAHKELLPQLQRWFESEWPTYYGASGPGNARLELQAFANVGSLPVGVVAFREGKVCGVAALKAESITSHRHLSPWAAAGLVTSAERGQGIGAQLLVALEREARALGFGHIYCQHRRIAAAAQRLAIARAHHSRGPASGHLPEGAVTTDNHGRRHIPGGPPWPNT
ncbi:MAG: GNAT family N-acetyltransferase [Burkholderiales bacterium]|nr:GNAT family N-acetyltransferase [Burkholderiales bacterium]